MKTRRSCLILVLFALALSMSRPAFAEPVKSTDVVQAFRTINGAPDLRLRTLSTSTLPVDSSTTGSSNPRQVPSKVFFNDVMGPSGLLSGVQFTDFQQDPQKVATQGDVEAVICDCGELTVAGGFPKWPLLFLAGIPLFFIHGDDDHGPSPTPTPTPTPTSTPTPSPTPAPIPEPASIILFLSGLSALALRRKMASKRTGPHE